MSYSMLVKVKGKLNANQRNAAKVLGVAVDEDIFSA
jgi:hypothetical protein